MARRLTKRRRWANRDTWMALFWVTVGFLAGTWHACGGMIGP